MITKVCGLSSATSIREIAPLSPSMMGFIFYAPSPRNACALLPSVVHEIPQGIERVGVFVDTPVDHILRTAMRYMLSAVQLHGRESPEQCARLRSHGLKVMKAAGINADIDWEELRAYGCAVDMFVFDTLTAIHGGSGRKFDWSILSDYPLAQPFLLSGGIGPGDAQAVIQAARRLPLMAGVDINSRFETVPGCKDTAAVAQFLNAL